MSDRPTVERLEELRRMLAGERIADELWAEIEALRGERNNVQRASDEHWASVQRAWSRVTELEAERDALQAQVERLRRKLECAAADLALAGDPNDSVESIKQVLAATAPERRDA